MLPILKNNDRFIRLDFLIRHHIVCSCLTNLSLKLLISSINQYWFMCKMFTLPFICAYQNVELNFSTRIYKNGIRQSGNDCVIGWAATSEKSWYKHVCPLSCASDWLSWIQQNWPELIWENIHVDFPNTIIESR